LKKIAYISCLGVVATLTVEFGVIGILPQIADHYQISIDKAGRLIGVYELVAAITGPFMALLVSNIDRKKVIAICLGISVFASLLSSLAPAFGLLLVARVMVALTDSVFHSVALASVIRNVDEKEDAAMMSIVLSGFSVAAITIIPLSAFVGTTFNWQLAFVVKAVVSGLALVSVLIVFPSMPVAIKKTFKGQLNILRKPIFILTAVLCLFMVTSAFSLYSYFADYLGEQKKMSGQMISYMLLIFGAMGIVGNWIAGKLAGKNLFMTSVATIVSVAIVAVGFQYSGTNTAFNILVIALWGLLFNIGPLVITTYINRAAPEAMEFGFALTASFIGLGIAAGTFLGGWVIANKGIQLAPWAGIGFGFVSLFVLVVIHRFKSEQQILR
jgi:predicted MFS family arabinose efflux permease